MAKLWELRDEVIKHQFSPIQYNDYADDRLNQAQRHICAQTDFMEIEQFLAIAWPAGQSYDAVPDDFNRIERLMRWDKDRWIPLKKMANAPYDMQRVQGGCPTTYKVQANFVSLNPTPGADETIGMTYYKVPPLLTQNDTPIIPEQYQYLMVHYALKHCYERENDYTSAQYHWGQFEQGIMKCRGEVHNSTNDYSQPRRVGDDAVAAFLVEGF